MSGSTVSLLSWVSAPARYTRRRCFRPSTVFRQRDGSIIRAAQLPREGGTLLQGPGGRVARVREVQRHAPQEREFVRFQTSEGSFEVTAEHRLLVEGPSGEPVPVEARCLMNVSSQARAVYNGWSFHEVISTEIFQDSAQVIEVCFDEDHVAVLAWLLPRRSVNRPASLKDAAAVACLGRSYSTHDILVRPCWNNRRTFVEHGDSSRESQAPRRSRSLGEAPDPRSHWSVGTIRHGVTDPGRCQICWPHHRFLRNSRLRPCFDGAACRRCHAPHPEVGRSRAEGRSLLLS